MSHWIYALYDPRNPNVVRYIGFTKKTLERRLIEHLSDARRGRMNHRCNWIRSLTKDNIRPIISIIEEVTENNWQEREKYWIRFYKETLTNTTEGGEGLINPSDEVREKISKKVSENLIGNQYRKGIPHTEESKKAISNALRNSKKHKESMATRIIEWTEERRKAMSVLKKGIKFTEEHKKRISESRKNSEASRISAMNRIGKKIPSSSAKKLGSKWINDGKIVKQLKANEPLPEGWVYGIKLKEK